MVNFLPNTPVQHQRGKWLTFKCLFEKGEQIGLNFEQGEMQCHHVHPFTRSTKWTSFQKNVCITTTVPVLLAETYQRKNGYTLRPDTGCVMYVSSTIARDAEPSFQSAFFVVRYGWRTAYKSNSSSLRMPHPHIFSARGCECADFDNQALPRRLSISAKSSNIKMRLTAA